MILNYIIYRVFFDEYEIGSFFNYYHCDRSPGRRICDVYPDKDQEKGHRDGGCSYLKDKQDYPIMVKK